MTDNAKKMHPQQAADLAVLSILPAFRCCALAARSGHVTQGMIDQERQQVSDMRMTAAKEQDELRRKAYEGWIVCFERRIDGAQKALMGAKK